MRIVAKTDIGNQRSENQDNYRAGRQPDETVWALVCDGMGGAQGGRLASGLAAASLEEFFTQGVQKADTRDEMRRFLFEAVDKANEVIFHKASETPELQGMGTTLVCGVLRGGLLQYVHVGDSRIYLLRNGVLQQLTRDHSMVQELLEQGSITEHEAAVHPQKNLITRALGVAAAVDADYGEKEVSPGDVMLMCTDGLTNFVPDSVIASVLAQTPFYEAADALVQKALTAGGLDNITVLLVKVEPVEDTRG